MQDIEYAWPYAAAGVNDSVLPVSYLLNPVLTQSGQFQLCVNVKMVQPGLSATFYGLSNLSEPVSYLFDGSLPNFFSSTLIDSSLFQNAFSMRWAGLIRPCSAQVYTFYTAISGRDQRIRLWIDNLLLIDMWQNVSATDGSGTIYFGLASNFYDIKIEYRQSTGPTKVSLRWYSYPAITSSDDQQSLATFSEISDTISRIFNITVLAGIMCSALSTMYGSGLTVATAGKFSVFTVVPRDEYYNIPRISYMRLFVSRSGSNEILDSLLNEMSEHEIRYLPFVAGIQDFKVSVIESGGIWATYYSGSNFESPAKSLFEPSIDHDWKTSSPGFGLGNDYFSVRWSGYVATAVEQRFLSATGAHNLFLSPEHVQLAADCISMSFNVSDVQKMCSSNNTPAHLRSELVQYAGEIPTPFILEYQSTVGEAACTLGWSTSASNDNTVGIDSSFLFGSTELMGSPALLVVFPGYPNLLDCTMIGVTIQTAGVNSNFVVQCKDLYNNDVAPVLSLYLRRRYGFPSSTFSSGMCVGDALNCSDVVFTVVEYTSGNFFDLALALSPGSVWATYYDGTDFGAFDARFTDLQPNFSYSVDPLRTWMSGQSGGLRMAGFWNVSNQWHQYLNVRISEPDERVKLWCDSILVIDQWTSLDNVLFDTLAFNVTTFSYSQQTYQLHEIRVEYKQYFGQMGFLIALLSNQTTQQIQSTALFAGTPFDGMNGDLFALDGQEIVVLPGKVCGSLCFVSGQGVTLSTVGMTSYFALQCSDQFKNPSTTSPFGLVFQNAAGLGRIRLENTLQTGLLTASYIPNSAGDYNATICSLVVNGVFATYFSSLEMEHPNFTTVMPVIDVSLLQDIGLITKNASFSVRWSGFVRPQFAQIYTLYAGVAGSDERIRLWIDSMLIIDMWDILPATSGSGTFSFDDANGFYEILVEYKQQSGNMGTLIQWTSDALDAALDVSYGVWASVDLRSIGSQSLFLCPSQNCHNNVMTVANDAQSICADCSIFGDGISVSTVGLSSKFAILCKDKYVVNGSSAAIAEFILPDSDVSSSDKRLLLVNSQNEVHSFSYSMTQSGEYSMMLSKGLFGGLLATYYDNMHFELNPGSSRVIVDTSFSFLWNSSNPIYSDGILSINNYVSIRWKGYIIPPNTGNYTFLLNLRKTSYDRTCAICVDVATLILDGNTVVEARSTRRNEANGTMYLMSGRVHDIEVRYKHAQGNAFFQLYWMSAVTPRSIIPSSVLLFMPCAISPRPLKVSVKSGVMSLNSSIIALPLSIVTAGMNALLVVSPKDEFGNGCEGVNQFAINLYVQRSGHLPSQVAVNAASIPSQLQFPFPVFISSSGANAITASLVLSGGLQATYFATDNFTMPLITRVDQVLDFSVSRGSELSGSIPLSPPFSARWAGFLKAQVAHLYSVFTGATGLGQSIKIWINSSLIIDTEENSTEMDGLINISTANVFYEIMVEYRQYGSGGIQLSWSSDSNSRSMITSAQLFHGQSPKFSFALMVYPGPVSVASTAHGTGLTASTSGLKARFTVVSRDLYGNIAEVTDSRIFVPHLYSVEPLFDIFYDVKTTGIVSINYNVRSNNLTGQFSVLLYGKLHITGSPWQLTILQADFCASLSLATGSGLTLATSGIFQEIRVLARDIFGNIRLNAQGLQSVFVAAVCNDQYSPFGSFACSQLWNFDNVDNGIWSTSVRFIPSGIYNLSIMLLAGNQFYFYSYSINCDWRILSH